MGVKNSRIRSMMATHENDFEDVFGANTMGGNMNNPQFTQVAEHYGPQHGQQPAYGMTDQGGGQGQWGAGGGSNIATIPAISIKAFCERQATAQLIASAASDRRMGRASFDIQSGGVLAAIEYLKANPSPNLLILECSGSAPDVIANIDVLAEYCDANIQVLVIGLTNDVQLYRELMKRGVSEYLVPPLETIQLVSSISNLFAEPGAFMGRSVAVVGAKGGVGSSTIAHNLGWMISKMDGINCSILDLDLTYGTSGLHFHVEVLNSIEGALVKNEGLNTESLQNYVTDVNDNLSIFAAPASLENFDNITPENYLTLLNEVRKTVPFVVVDIPNVWGKWTEEVVLTADEIYVVCEPELASLRNTKSLIEKISQARSGDAPPTVIFNKTGMPGRPEISPKDFGNAVGVAPSYSIPFHTELFGKALNNGSMLDEIDSSAAPNEQITAIACSLTGKEVPPPPQKKSIFSQFKSKSAR